MFKRQIIKKAKKRTEHRILTEIYLRLAYYYELSETTKNIYSLIKKELDPNALLTKKLTQEEGWAFLDIIEKKIESKGKKIESKGILLYDCPYGSPNTWRYKYLSNELIQQDTFIYFVKKPTDSTRRQYREPIYRLKRDISSRKKVLEFMENNASKVEYDLFLRSPYYRETQPRTTFNKSLFTFQNKLNFISEVLAYKDENGEFIRDKDIFQATLNSLNDLKKLFEDSKEYKETISNINISAKIKDTDTFLLSEEDLSEINISKVLDLEDNLSKNREIRTLQKRAESILKTKKIKRRL